MNIDLPSVLLQVEAFLKKHPTETVIMSWQPARNHDPDENPIEDYASLNDMFMIQMPNASDGFERNYNNLVYIGEHYNSEYSTPTLGEVRGKIVLLNPVGLLHNRGSTQS